MIGVRRRAVAILEDYANYYSKKDVDNLAEVLGEARTEAIREFAERLKPKLRNNAHVSPFASNLNDVIIDNLVKEMTEGQP